MVHRLIPSIALVVLIGGCAPTQTSTTKPTTKPTAHHKHHHSHAGRHPHAHHGPIGHRFTDAAKWAKVFDDPKRDAWQKPDAVVALLKLGKADTVADIGSGTGYFAVRLARAVPEGEVYGIDIEPDMVKYLADRARREGLSNIVSILGTTQHKRVPDKLDLVFVCDTYHHIPKRVDYFKTVAQKMLSGGRLVIVDFKKEKTPMGPPIAHRFTPEQVEAELTKAGYVKVSSDTTTLPYQYILTYKKP